MSLALPSVPQHCAARHDPRADRTTDHQVLAIVTIALGALICGAAAWTECEAVGQAKLAWLRTVLALPNGIPAHDPCGRVFARLDPGPFQQCLLRWLQASPTRLAGLTAAVALDHVGLDGKPRRRSHDRAAGTAARHLVSAWAWANRLVLGHVAVGDKSNEITALPVLIHLLDLSGGLVTIAAMGCPTAIAAAIVEQGGAYGLALKGRQGRLHQAGAALCAQARAPGFTGIAHPTSRTLENGHGRSEERRWWPIHAPE